VNRLSMLHENGRRFEVIEAIERGSAVALGLAVSEPEWSGTVEVFKVFTFDVTGDSVVGMQDCDSRRSALAMLEDC
jgi:hypothetical protein